MEGFIKKNMENITCPICGSLEIIFFHVKNNYNIYSCKNCEAGFVFPTPGDLKNIYTKGYFKSENRNSGHGYVNYDKDKEPMRIIFENYLKEAEKLMTGRRIFDIGTATGYFLDLAKKRGWETYGSDISSYATETARRRGHEVIVGDLANIKINKKFNVVTLWDVLEHLEDPKKYLEIANGILEDGGILFINTVNIRSVWARLMGKRWHLIVPPEHLFYFSPKSLRILLKNSGFTLLSMRSQGKKFTLAYVFKILYGWQGFRAWNGLSNFFDKKFFNKFYVPIKLGDNILIIAKK